MQTGPGYQTSCWQLHSIQLVPGDLGSQPVPTHKCLCRLTHVEHSSGLLSPLHNRMPANLLHLRTSPRQSSNKNNTQQIKNNTKQNTKKERGRERKTQNLSCIPCLPCPFLWGEKILPGNSHDVFILFILMGFTIGIQGLLVSLSLVF